MMDSSRIIPKIREEIYFNSLSDVEYILCNSKHDHYLKINEQTYNLLSLVDNERSIDEICITYNEQYNTNIKTEDVLTLFRKKLLPFGVFMGYEDAIKPYSKPSYLKFSFIILKAKTLSSIVKWFYPLFKRKVFFFVLSFSIIVLTFLAIRNLDIYRSFDVQESIYLFFLVMAMSVTFHEIGHATSASYFGTKLGGIGGGFYLFTPVYYADVTDIWRLPKSQRIIVNLAGMYFEILFCSIISILAYFTESYTLLVVTLFVCIHTFFNLNPFIRSDGYWILSDLTNKPNLFYHSRKKIIEITRFIFRKSRTLSWSFADYFLFAYGLCSFVFIGFFLFYVLFKNPNSILLFPQNIYNFGINLINGADVSIIDYGELVVPMIFFLLIYRFMKTLVVKLLRKN